MPERTWTFGWAPRIALLSAVVPLAPAAAHGCLSPRGAVVLPERGGSAARPGAVPSAAAAAASREPEAFLRALLRAPPSERFVSARLAVERLPGRAAQWDFMLRCVELVAAEPEWASKATLVTLVSGLRPTPRDFDDAGADSDLAAARRRALSAAVRLWRAGTATGAAAAADADDSGACTRALRNAARVVSEWGATEEDAVVSQQLADVRGMISDLIHHEAWEYVVDLLPRFPSLGAPGAGSLVGGLPERVAASCGLLDLPNPEARGAERVQKRLAAGKPMRAIFSCGRSIGLRRLCLRLLLEEGMLELARNQADLWWQPLRIGREELVHQELRRRRYLRSPRGLRISWVDRPEQLGEAFEHLGWARAVGLDLELSLKGAPALLQLATPHHAVLVDLLALGSCTALGVVLAGLFANAATVKLGFGGTQDVKYLRKLPSLSACLERPPEPYVDVQKLAKDHPAASSGGLGLSAISQAVLGRPLDKQLQVSDWTRRPLSEAQARYAAMDAWVLLELHDRLRQPRAAPSGSGPAARLLRALLAALRGAWFELRTRSLPRPVALAGWLRRAAAARH